MSDLRTVRQELSQELKDILAYWQKYGPDPVGGGYYGQVDYKNFPKTDAPKGIVLNSRIVWTFAAAARHTQHDEYLTYAERAYKYIDRFFRDKQNGGVYWLVDYKGEPLQPVKHLYGQSFAIYGLSEYYRATKHEPALAFAREIYDRMVRHAWDSAKGGFIDARARDWSPTDDFVMSNRANGETKTMNTHLHILEAFTNLYRAWPDPGLNRQIRGLIDVFLNHIIDPKTYRMHLFLDDNWKIRRTAVSYGHDIEASWLLAEAAEVLHDEALLKKVKNVCIRMARAAATGVESDGGMNYEYDPKTGHVNRERSWWVMSEAMVGFMNAYQLTKEKQFLDKSLKSWEFIRKYMLDTKNGEWFSGIDEKHNVLGSVKISMWKCPYHNGRACIEMVDRLTT
ncbi:AGE family epimerase/isomerase [Larkinella soli]|uniref:AGE family epimerase/isomerase n=1 Tax=Larkinella soli TaxID=1770527 RepID=UPI000FFB517C|nr:AGE family epimerase/isomerase [Larkinella soli]